MNVLLYAILQLKYFWEVAGTRDQYEPLKVLNQLL